MSTFAGLPFVVKFDSRHPASYRGTRRRPFAAGIDPDARTWFSPPPSPVARLMRHLRYPPCNVEAAEAWIAERGTVAGCPVVEPWHVEAIDAAAGVAPAPAPPSPPRSGVIPRALAERLAAMGNPW
jgi:hypothetical protein